MEEKLKELQAKLDERVKSANGTLKTEIENLIEEVKSAKAEAETVKSLEKRIADVEVAAVKAAKSIEEAKGGESFGRVLKQALGDNADKLKQIANGELNTIKFELKAVGNITSANITGDVPQADRFSGFNAVPSRTVRLLDLMSPRTTSSDKVEWVYQSGKEGSAGQTAEGSAYNQIDFDWVVGSEDIKKTTAYIKATDEMLAKGDVVEQEIRNELLRELLKAVENSAYSGNAAGANLRGITTVASAFSAATVGAGSVDNANEVDVLTVAMTQIKIAQEGDASPSAIMMNPADVAKLKLVKLSATDKRYIDRLMFAGQNLSVDGVPIIESTLIPAGDYLVGDFSKAELVQRDGITIEIGLDDTDFTTGFKTIRAQWRGALVVRNNNRSAFVAGDFATDKAALETA